MYFFNEKGTRINMYSFIGIIRHKDAIEQIMLSSKAELELETKLRQIEEEWTEQVSRLF